MGMYLNLSIKEVIQKFPQIEKILNEYEIACGTCTMGLCLLKDILEIHKLPPAESKILMERIGRVITKGPEENLEEKKILSRPRPNVCSPAMKILVAEHNWIKKWLALIPEVITHITLNPPEKRDLILAGVDFIRNYADKFHHAKEEEILFKYFSPELEILKVMKEDHTTARKLRQAILDSLDQDDEHGLSTNLQAYQQLLSQHIKKEDEVLFPWLEKQLSPGQLSDLFSKFQEVELPADFHPQDYENFIQNLEEKLKGLGLMANTLKAR